MLNNRIEEARKIIFNARDEGREFLYEHEAKEICSLYGIPTPRFVFSEKENMLFQQANNLNFPLVLKGVARGVVHKSEAGLVFLNIGDLERLRSVCGEVRRRAGERLVGFLLEEMVGKGVETIVGAKNDRLFGPVILFGAGGIYSELLQDVKIWLVEENREEEIPELIKDTKVYRILLGYRGRRYDVESLINLIKQVKRLVVELKEIAEIDLNPVIVTENQAKVVDARIRINSGNIIEPEMVERPAFIEKFLYPRTVAVVGASQDRRKYGGKVLECVKASKVAGIFPVNPRYESINGLKCYPNLLSIGEEVDLAIVAVPNTSVPKVVEEAVEKGIPAVIVISAGFSEIGDEGRRLQEVIVETANKGVTRIIGPNCYGVINTDPTINLNATFGIPVRKRGNVSFISQSGDIAEAVISFFEERGLGLSKAISLGNTADIDFPELMEYLMEDDGTKVVALYVEWVKNPRRFMRIAKRLCTRKPVVVMKSGITKRGAIVASTHTGALAGDDRLYEALFQQSGMIRVGSIEEMIDTCMAFSLLKQPTGERIAILTNSGGPAIIAVDELYSRGVELYDFSEGLKNTLQGVVSPHVRVGNPLDVASDSDINIMLKPLEILLSSGEVDILMVIVEGGPAWYNISEWAGEIGRRIKESRKPAIFVWMYDKELVREGHEILRKYGIPVYETPERGARALANIIKYGRILQKLKK